MILDNGYAGGVAGFLARAREPRRLWKRYLHYNPRFVTGFARQWVTQRPR